MVTMDKSEYKNHWETVFKEKDTSKVSWYQDKPLTSLNLINEYAHSKESSIIDIGAGDSRLPDFLLSESYKSISALDISNKALEVTKARLAERAPEINWQVTNVLDFEPKEKYDLWHDRAVFHFISDQKDRLRYKDVLQAGTTQNGIVIIGSFSTNEGPLKCSGLFVKQHDRNSISEIFLPEFEIIHDFEEMHSKPSGGQQNFYWVVLRNVTPAQF